MREATKVGTTHWGMPGGPGTPWWVAPPSGHPQVLLWPIGSLLVHKQSTKSFAVFGELSFLHKKNTMVVLLKTTSVRVSSIQIMQVRVQNKGKSVWKSRYVGDVSTPPSLNLCLSSSNSVDKLKVIKKNFYKLCLLLLL